MTLQILVFGRSFTELLLLKDREDEFKNTTEISDIKVSVKIFDQTTEYINDQKAEDFYLYICLSREETDTYTIMEELEIQRYDKHYYFCHPTTKELELKYYVDLIKDEFDMDEDEKTIKYYKIYSGLLLPENTPLIDLQAIYGRMILLCELVIKYLSFNLQSVYKIKVIRELPVSSSVGKFTLDESAYQFTQKQIDDMVYHSNLFQMEDPLIKGFLLAHPATEISEEFAHNSYYQDLIFTSGQFRIEFLNSIIKTIVRFAYINELYIVTDYEKLNRETKSAKPKKETKSTKPKKEKITSSDVPSASKLLGKTKDASVESSLKKIYYNPSLWTSLIEKIEEKINTLDGP